MANNFNSKNKLHFINIGAILLLTVTLFFCILPANGHAEEKSPAASKADKGMPHMGMSDAAATFIGPCKGLKAFKNIDELMFQIYSNLESDCLFKMDPKELAEIWRIPTIVYRYKKTSIVRRPPVEGDHDYLLLKAFKDEDENPNKLRYFIIEIDYGKKAEDYPFFPDHGYPKLLPEPSVCSTMTLALC